MSIYSSVYVLCRYCVCGLIPESRKVLCLQQLIHQRCSFVKLDGGINLQARFVNQFFCKVCVCALEAHNNRHAYGSHVLVSINDALRHPVAPYNTSKYIDQDGFNMFIFQNNTKRFFNTLGVGGSAHVKKVGRLAAAE